LTVTNATPKQVSCQKTSLDFLSRGIILVTTGAAPIAKGFNVYRDKETALLAEIERLNLKNQELEIVVSSLRKKKRTFLGFLQFYWSSSPILFLNFLITTFVQLPLSIALGNHFITGMLLITFFWHPLFVFNEYGLKLEEEQNVQR
jgi:hypothetical protein